MHKADIHIQLAQTTKQSHMDILCLQTTGSVAPLVLFIRQVSVAARRNVKFSHLESVVVKSTSDVKSSAGSFDEGSPSLRRSFAKPVLILNNLLQMNQKGMV